jgi:hypothetical protein
MSLVGTWSTLLFYPHDPADDVLVFLPDGTGVYEYYWWRLSFYATFTYTLVDDLLTVVGVSDHDFDFETKTQQESAADWRFATRISFATGSGALPADEPVEILQLEEALPMTSQVRFGRSTAAADMQYYSIPSFWEEYPSDESPEA